MPNRIDCRLLAPASGACLAPEPASRAGSSSGLRGVFATARVAVATLTVLLGIAGCADAPVVRWHSLVMSPDAVSSPMAVMPVGNAATAVALVTQPLVVELTIVRVPAEVDQPQWLVRLPDETLRVLETERWAAPLRDELRAAVMQVLTARWGAVDARSRPPEPTIDAIRDALPQPGLPPPATAVGTPDQPAAGRPAMAAGRPAVSAVPAVTGDGAPSPSSPPPQSPAPRRVTVDVTRFESLPDREARLDASWTVSAASAPLPRASQASAAPPVLACRSAFREPVGSGAPALAAGHRRAVAALGDAIGRALQAGRDAACPPAAAGR